MASACALYACRDLSFADPEAANVGPRVSFPNLSDGQKLPIRWQLELGVEDTDGIRSASVWCHRPSDGERVLVASWSAAPFVKDVSFTACLPSTSGVIHLVPTDLMLEASAVDNRGLPSAVPVRRWVHVDPMLPGVTLDLQASVLPNKPVPFEIRSDLELIAPPTVVIEGIAVQVVPGNEPRTWNASFTAPPLGTDSTGGTSDSLSVLEDIRRVLPLTVSAVAVNGNSVSVTRDVVVSRVLWERVVPGQIRSAPDGGSPTAADGLPVSNDQGLWVPLASEGVATAFSGWLPGFVEAKTGQFRGPSFDPTRFTGRALGRDGTAIVEEKSAAGAPMSSWLIDPTGETRMVTDVLDGLRPALRFADRTCVQQEKELNACSGSGTHQLECISGAGFSESQPIPFTGIPGTSGLGSVSGDTALSVEFVDWQCKSTLDNGTLLLLKGDGGTVTSIPNGQVSDFYRVIPLGQSGRFAVDFRDAFGLRAAQRIRQDGQPELTYFTAQDPTVPMESILDVVVGRDDGSLVTLTTADSVGVLRAWKAAATTTQPLPDFFQRPSVNDQLNAMPYGVSFPDGRIAVLAKTHEYGRAVIATDAQLRPRWIYRYPRGTQSAMLLSDSANGHLYLVDFQNNVVVALSRDW